MNRDEIYSECGVIVPGAAVRLTVRPAPGAGWLRAAPDGCMYVMTQHGMIFCPVRSTSYYNHDGGKKKAVGKTWTKSRDEVISLSKGASLTRTQETWRSRPCRSFGCLICKHISALLGFVCEVTMMAIKRYTILSRPQPTSIDGCREPLIRHGSVGKPRVKWQMGAYLAPWQDAPEFLRLCCLPLIISCCAVKDSQDERAKY